MVRVQKAQIYEIADLLLREECVFLVAVNTDYVKNTSYSLRQCLWNATTSGHIANLFLCVMLFSSFLFSWS